MRKLIENNVLPSGSSLEEFARETLGARLGSQRAARRIAVRRGGPVDGFFKSHI